MSQLTLAELRVRHAWNDRWRDLLTKLEDSINQWRSEVPEIRLWLFGSYLSDKPEPNDIDVLLTGRLHGPPRISRKYPNHIQVLPWLSTKPQTKADVIPLSIGRMETSTVRFG